MAAATNGVAEWLYTTLRASTVLTSALGGTAAFRAYEGVAPQGAVSPYITYACLTSIDEMAVGGRTTTNQLWIVKATAQGGTFNAVAPLASAIDTALDRQRGTATTNGVTIAACQRTEEVRRDEQANGIGYKHIGGVYRIYAG